METILSKFARILNPTRMHYPYFIGAALWLGWLISILIGPGNLDAAGHLIGTDFVAFYTAGKILLQGESTNLYELELARQIQQPLYGHPSENFNPYLNPPFYAWLFIPFAALPYPLSPILWMMLNLLLLWGSLKILTPHKTIRAFWLALTWLPAFAAISFGQNAFLSLFILSFVYRSWQEGLSFRTGLTSGLLLYKPQLLLGIGLLWLLDLRKSWRAILGIFISGGILLLVSYLFMPEATLEYYTYTQRIAANLMRIEGFPIWNAHAVGSFWLGLFPDRLALAFFLYAICALVGLWFFFKFWRSTSNPALRFGAMICLTIWITPYIMVYDWVLLLIPAVLFWQECKEKQDQLKVIYAFLWVVMFFSGALTYAQWTAFGRAVQLSIPALLVTLILGYRVISKLPLVEGSLSAG